MGRSGRSGGTRPSLNATDPLVKSLIDCRALLREMTEGLAESGYRSAVLWVGPDNHRARRLYESEGWVHDSVAREAEALGVMVSEVRYRRPLVHIA